MDSNLIKRAAETIERAEALVICAGAGMGVDSGLPDFRGDKGFWKAYPAFGKLNLGFVDLANPAWFEKDPALAWGFYGHRLVLYRSTMPHRGFQILRGFASRMKHGAYVFTSNVDGQFQKAGFAEDRVIEAHGSIHWMQCTGMCGAGIFSAEPYHLEIDLETFRAREPWPSCPKCGALARPNILMFGDGEWEGTRSHDQSRRLHAWQHELPDTPGKLVIIECGAGSAVPTVRSFSEQIVNLKKATLIRINPRECEVPPAQIGIDAGAMAALDEINQAILAR